MYRKRIVSGYSGPEYWQWFDLMPKETREALNNAKTVDEAFYLWQDAINKYGDKIERKLENMNYMIVNQYNTLIWEGKAENELNAWDKMYDCTKTPIAARDIEASKKQGMRIIEAT